MDVLIAGGGTGGHLFPGIALAQEIRRRDSNSRILFLGSPRGLEVRAVPRAGFELKLLPVSGLRGLGVARIFVGLIRLPISLLKAIFIVGRFRPQVAISCGGYAAGPGVLAAWLLGVPCIVLEQNALMGTTNRLLGKLATRIMASLPIERGNSDKVRVLGNPVRPDLLSVREKSYNPKSPLELLVFGGSQGARALNEVMMELAPLLVREQTQIQITHQTGQADFERVKRAYEDAGLSGVTVLPFIDDMKSAYEKADLILSRAGATTIAEATVCGRPLLMVPFPYAVDDHQSENAKAVEAGGGGIQLPQATLDHESLHDLLNNLLEDPKRLSMMASNSKIMGKPDALRSIVDAIETEIVNV